MQEGTSSETKLNQSGNDNEDETGAPRALDESISELRRVRKRELTLMRLAGEISCAECHRYELLARFC